MSDKLFNSTMSKTEINIVWLKRDIRSRDHLPLHLAEQDGLPYLIVFVFEPGMINYPDCSLRHLQFQYHSLKQLHDKLTRYGHEVKMFYSEVIPVFDLILDHFNIRKLFSYQESGIELTYTRDKQVRNYCQRKKIEWIQCQRDGIVRGIHNRVGWDRQWFQTMHSSQVENKFSVQHELPLPTKFEIPEVWKIKLEHYTDVFQPPGEDNAFRYLESFVKERGKNYSHHISKPSESRLGCMRISPYLSWGNISVRQAYQYVYGHLASSEFKKPLQNALTRLHWHCHFIQKFENECSYETKCVNKGFELLSHEHNDAFIQAWKQGATGIPLVDACMRCLMTTGWINFRMRAMLVSFLCFHLDQDWRSGVYHLAQLFLDYEPGIHYTQFQMQAGTTGVNTIRIYNPLKQAIDHDPQGKFIRTWIPELSKVPDEFIHEPHKMTQMEQKIYGVEMGADYPYPIVDLESAGKAAREKIWSHRKHEEVKRDGLRILEKHVRKRGAKKE